MLLIAGNDHIPSREAYRPEKSSTLGLPGFDSMFTLRESGRGWFLDHGSQSCTHKPGQLVFLQRAERTRGMLYGLAFLGRDKHPGHHQPEPDPAARHVLRDVEGDRLYRGRPN